MRVSFCFLIAILVACGDGGPTPPPNSLVGTWGGDDAGLVVTDVGAHAHVGCTLGDIPDPIVPGGDGRFDVPGEYNINAYPVDLGIRHPARFIGVVDGGHMSLTIVLTDTAVSFGPVQLRYGREPEMRMCPICRIVPSRTLDEPPSRDAIGPVPEAKPSSSGRPAPD